MAEPIKRTGRRVRELNGMAEWDVAQAKLALIDSLGETDPVRWQRAMRKSLRHLEAAHASIRGIEEICALAAVRGNYKKDEG